MHDKILVVYFSCTVFDAVENPKLKDKEGDKQFMGDLPACTDDIDAFKDAMEYYGANDPEDCYVLHNADFKTCNGKFRDL